MITADPIHPRISGVGYLYTTEYYESIKRRLRPDGIVCQWMPMYQVSRVSFDVAFRSFASVFPHASFWYVRGHGLFVATQTPFRVDYSTLEERFRDPLLRGDLASIQIDSPSKLLTHMLMGPTEVAGYLASTGSRQVNTDDNAYLEYKTPFEFLKPTRDILVALLSFSRLDDRVVVNIPDRARAELHSLWEQRKAEIMPEIDRIAP
jgi:spermidine synthase